MHNREDSSSIIAKITLMYSVTDSFGHFNSSGTIAQLAIVERSLKWTDVEIARLIHVIFRPILFIFGSAGNCLSFYIMRGTALKNVSSCFYMSILALADTGK